MNNVSLSGRLVRDPELRTTNTGKDVCEFTLAVRKRIKPNDGSPDADFIRCKAWEQPARFAAEYFFKGRLVGVEGRIETRKYTDQQGANREIVEVVCHHVEALERIRDDQGGGQPAQRTGGGSRTPAPAADEYDPFADE